jgi:hypothetical protein
MQGAHFLGGRFVPPAIKQQYSLVLPPYPGASQHVRLPFDAADIGSNGTGVQAASSQGQQQPSSSSPSAGTVTSPSGITSSVQELGAKVGDDLGVVGVLGEVGGPGVAGGAGWGR